MTQQSIKEIVKVHASCQLRNAGDGIAEFVQGSHTVAAIPWVELFELVRKGETRRRISLQDEMDEERVEVLDDSMICRDLIFQWARRNEVRRNLLRKAAPDLHARMCERPPLAEQYVLLRRLMKCRSRMQNSYPIGMAVLAIGVFCLMGSLFLNRHMFIAKVPLNTMTAPQKIEACSHMINQLESNGYTIINDMRLVIELFKLYQDEKSPEALTAKQEKMVKEIQNTIVQWQSMNTEL